MKVSPGAAQEVMRSCLNHLWYLFPQTVVLALCDPGLGIEEKKDLAAKLHGMPKSVVTSGRPMEEVTRGKGKMGRKVVISMGQRDPFIKWSIEEGSRPALSSLVGPESWMIFQQLGLSGPQVEIYFFSSKLLSFCPGRTGSSSPLSTGGATRTTRSSRVMLSIFPSSMTALKEASDSSVILWT
jgi:hypothetical protein